MRLLPALLFLVLTTDPAAAQKLDSILDADRPLPAGPMAWWDGKAARLGAADGPIVKATGWGPHRVLVMDPPADGPVRVILPGDHLRLVLVVEPASLATAVAVDTFLPARDRAERGSRVPGIWAFAGTPITQVAPGRYRVRSGAVTATVAAGDEKVMSRFFQPTRNDPWDPTGDVLVRTDTSLLDAPGGRPFGRITIDAPLTVLRGGRGDVHVLVRYRTRELVTIGWVRRADLRFPGDEEEEEDGGELGGVEGGIDGGVDLQGSGRALKRGALVYDGPRGRPVGVALGGAFDAGVTVVAQRDGWAEIHPQAATVAVRVWAPSSALGPIAGFTIPPPPPGRPRTIDMTTFQSLRTAGEPVALAAHAAALRAAGIVEVGAGVEMCLAADGTISKAATLETSGVAALDAALLATVKSWRFRPHPAGAVCARLLYHMSL